MRPGAIVGGGFLLVVGVTMWLDSRGLEDLRHVIGPACLIILGMLMLVEDGGFVCGRRERLADGSARTNLRKGGGLTGGLWLLGVGCWMLVSQLHVFGLEYGTSWPLLIILSGAIMLVRGVR
jgi:LiaI-LiaF-like transmembrane region